MDSSEIFLRLSRRSRPSSLRSLSSRAPLRERKSKLKEEVSYERDQRNEVTLLCAEFTSLFSTDALKRMPQQHVVKFVQRAEHDQAVSEKPLKLWHTSLESVPNTSLSNMDTLLYLVNSPRNSTPLRTQARFRMLGLIDFDSSDVRTT